MYKKKKKELFNELVIEPDAKFNYNYEFSLAYNQTIKTLPTSPKDVIKQVIKEILVEKLELNAKAEHKTLFGKIGAFLSKVAAVVLPLINFNKNK